MVCYIGIFQVVLPLKVMQCPNALKVAVYSLVSPDATAHAKDVEGWVGL